MRDLSYAHLKQLLDSLLETNITSTSRLEAAAATVVRLKQMRELAALDTTAARLDLESAQAAYDASGGTVEQATDAHRIADIPTRSSPPRLCRSLPGNGIGWHGDGAVTKRFTLQDHAVRWVRSERGAGISVQGEHLVNRQVDGSSGVIPRQRIR
jgi:hypothetical protein